MANTYTKIYLHIVFAVKGRECLLPSALLPRVHTYMAGILREQGHYPVAIGGTENHVHLLIDYKPAISLPDTLQALKTATTKMINENHLIPFKFAWQRGYGCFSYAPSQVPAVVTYIENQREHHRKKGLREEMMEILGNFGITYSDQYLFEE